MSSFSSFRRQTKKRRVFKPGKFAKLGLAAGKAAGATPYYRTASADNAAGGRNK